MALRYFIEPCTHDNGNQTKAVYNIGGFTDTWHSILIDRLYVDIVHIMTIIVFLDILNKYDAIHPYSFRFLNHHHQGLQILFQVSPVMNQDF